MYPDHELQVTATGQVENEPGSRALHLLILDELKSRKGEGGQRQLPAVRTAGTSPPHKVVLESAADGVLVQQLSLESEPGVTLRARLHTPQSSGRKQAVLLLLSKSSEASAAGIARRGRIVLELEPRQSPTGYDSRPYLGDWRTNTRAGMVGRSLALMRAQDIVRGVDLLASKPEVVDLRAAAGGVQGIWLLLAAAADDRLAKIWLDRTPHSLRSALDTPLTTDLHDAVIPGALLHWDLKDLVQAMGRRTVLWTDPANWMRRTVALGAPYRYRYLGEPDDNLLEEFLR